MNVGRFNERNKRSVADYQARIAILEQQIAEATELMELKQMPQWKVIERLIDEYIAALEGERRQLNPITAEGQFRQIFTSGVIVGIMKIMNLPEDKRKELVFGKVIEEKNKTQREFVEDYPQNV